MESLGDFGSRAELDQTAQTAARLVHRRSAVQQRCVVDEIGRDGREVGHAEHGVVDAHTVPRHLRVRGRRAAEGDRRERGAAVALDEYGRVEGQDVGHRESDVLFQCERIELRFLHADFFHRPMSDDRDFRYGKMPGRPLFTFRLLRKERRGETCHQSE